MLEGHMLIKKHRQRTWTMTWQVEQASDPSQAPENTSTESQDYGACDQELQDYWHTPYDLPDARL